MESVLLGASFELVLTVSAFVTVRQFRELRALCSAATELPVKLVAETRAFTMCVVGGTEGSSIRVSTSLECLRPGAHSWDISPSLQTPRLAAVGLAYRGCFYVCGGSTESWGPGHVAGDNLCSVEMFDAEWQTWESAPDMRERRSAACGVVLGEHLYVAGGEGGSNREYVLNAVEQFRPGAGGYDGASNADSSEWEVLSPMKAHRYGAACAVVGQRLVVCGGSIGLFARRSVEAFRPAAGRWEPLPDMIHCRVGALACAAGSCVVVCGGEPHNAATVEQLDLRRGAWELLAPLPFGLEKKAVGITSGVASAGRLFLFGCDLPTEFGEPEAGKSTTAVSIDVKTREVTRLPHTQALRSMSIVGRFKL